MSEKRTIKNALISVFHKEGLAPIVEKLNELGVNIYSTGGTQSFIEKKGITVNRVEDLTTYPSILGGRVKTLHPNVFGGILSRRELASDKEQLEQYNIPEFDLVIVDLYPFEKTVSSGASEQDVIEKIDIGGISLIRAAAKNFKDVLIVSEMNQYAETLEMLNNNGASTNMAERKKFAGTAFNVSSHYDTAIFNYFNTENTPAFKASIREGKTLRYGENPHQSGTFYGNLDAMFTKLNGKELSYNNLLDIDAAVHLITEFNETTFVVLKHNNACGLASRPNLLDAWTAALAGDPTSAFGGVLITNKEVDLATAEEINKLFYEVLIAPSFATDAFELLKGKKNRVLLKQNQVTLPQAQFRTALNGVLYQDKDLKSDAITDMVTATHLAPTQEQLSDLQAVDKAKKFGFDLNGCVMASDAFFPFPDCVELANNAGIKAVIQPGGSIKDELSIEYCNNNNMTMVLTGIRHFKH